MKGPGDFDQAADDERHEVLTDEIMASWQDDPAKIAEADEWWSGTLDSKDYETIESALADLGSGVASEIVLSRLTDIATFCAEQRNEWLRHISENAAVAQIIHEDAISDEMRSNPTGEG